MLGVAFLAPVVVKFALAFGSAVYFSPMVLAFIARSDQPVCRLRNRHDRRGLQTGQPRFTFGMTELLDGVDVITAAVGLFAVGDVLGDVHGGAGEQALSFYGDIAVALDGGATLQDAVSLRLDRFFAEEKGYVPASAIASIR